MHKLIATLTLAVTSLIAAQTPTSPKSPGEPIFVQNCAFCHGRDAGGGEEGPDLTRSKLVTDDVGGDKIGPVVLNGRQDKGMPRFKLSDAEIKDLADFIHTQKKIAESQKGGRRGVDVADLQTGNVEAGKKYFEGAGNCTKCHSVTGDLKGVATRFEGLKLEKRIVYPKGTAPKIVVTLPSGEKVAGKIAYQDEFTIGIRDANDWYRSWRVASVKFTVDDPAQAHADLLSKYTDDDIHNLMAYIQTLR